MLSCGIDVGSVQTKAVIIDGNMVVQGRGLVHSGANLLRAARHALDSALREAGCEEWDLTFTMGTGYGRFNIPFSNDRATEPACHARGAVYRYPQTRTVLDIGGQDTTTIKIDRHGNILDFCMNDKCAAGTGRFLESLADLFGLKIEEIGELGLRGTRAIPVTNVCSVLSEQEIINHLESGKAVEDILAGVYSALARRASSLVRRVGIEEEVTITGGVSQNHGMVKAIGDLLEVRSNTGVDGVYVGALGAALLGLEQVIPSIRRRD